MKDVEHIEDLERLRLLSDPLKLRLIQAFAEAEATIGEVAEALGEPLTKLYRHVDALLEAGLIEVTRTRRKRGTVERHFRAVARRYEVKRDLLAAGSHGEEDDSSRALLRGAEEEILGALRANDEVFPPTVARFRVKASPERLAELEQRLFDWLEETEAADEEPGAHTIEVGALIALYRLPGN